MQPTFQEVTLAYLDCRRHKRSTEAAMHFENHLAGNLRRLHGELCDGSYRIGPSRCFVVLHPKPREVWAGAFRDRIVHHLAYNRLSPKAYRTFSADSCACIPGRGTLYGANRLGGHIRSATKNWSKRVYYLKMDLSNFFVSIHKPTLANLLEPLFEDDFTRDLARQILFHDPTRSVEIRSPRWKMNRVPRHKSLFNAPHGCGLAIGNLPSQFEANVYLNLLDQLVNHRLKPAGYIRYVDDFILLHEDRDWLLSAQAQIEAFLWQRLRLQANPRKTVINTCERGVDFVGQVIKPWHRVARSTLYPAAKRAIRQAPDDTTRCASANSYLGILGQTASYRQRVALCETAAAYGHPVDPERRKVLAEQKPAATQPAPALGSRQ